MKLYNVNIYKEITFICGYYGENDLVNKVLVMFAHIWLCSRCWHTTWRLFLIGSLPQAAGNQSYTDKTSHITWRRVSFSFPPLNVDRCSFSFVWQPLAFTCHLPEHATGLIAMNYSWPPSGQAGPAEPQQATRTAEGSRGGGGIKQSGTGKHGASPGKSQHNHTFLLSFLNEKRERPPLLHVQTAGESQAEFTGIDGGRAKPVACPSVALCTRPLSSRGRRVRGHVPRIFSQIDAVEDPRHLINKVTHH